MEVAESSLKDSHEKDETFAGEFRRLCVTYLGQTGRDLVDLALEEQFLFPPLRSEEDMRKLRDYSLSHIIHPLKRRIIRNESEDQIRKAMTIYSP